MKRVITILLMMCSITLVQAQTLKDHRMSDASEMSKLEKMVEDFCYYVKVIGNTRSLSREEKNNLRNNEIPKLFYYYPERYMYTTSGIDGSIKNRKKMHDYFYNLQRQAGKPKTGLGYQVNVEYDLQFQFACNDGKLVWKYVKTHKDGSKEYESYVWIYQTYLKQTLNGDMEIMRSRREVDKKKMVAKKMVLPNGSESLKLHNITQAERLQTRN